MDDAFAADLATAATEVQASHQALVDADIALATATDTRTTAVSRRDASVAAMTALLAKA